MSGSKKTETTQATRDPWAPAQPVLNDVLSNAQKIGGDVSNFTPTYSDATQQGVANLKAMGQQPLAQKSAFENLAQGTRGAFNTGLDTLTQTANGGMLNSNPYLDQVLEISRRNAANSVNQQFSGAGRYGSGNHAGVLADRLGNIETNARMGQYNTERGNQMNAANILQGMGMQSGQMAAGVDNANLQGNQLLLQAGGLQDQMDAAKRAAPLQATQWMAGLGTPIAGLGGTRNSTSTTSTPANVPGMIGGGLMAGLGLATGNPNMLMGGIGGASGGGFGGGGGQQTMAGAGKPFFGWGQG